MTLLGPQINNMPSKSHVIVLFFNRLYSRSMVTMIFSNSYANKPCAFSGGKHWKGTRIRRAWHIQNTILLQENTDGIPIEFQHMPFKLITSANICCQKKRANVPKNDVYTITPSNQIACPLV